MNFFVMLISHIQFIQSVVYHRTFQLSLQNIMKLFINLSRIFISVYLLENIICQIYVNQRDLFSVYDVKAIKYTYNLKPILLVQILEHWQSLSSINFQSLFVCFGIVLPSHFSSPRKVFSQFYFRAVDQHQNWFYTNLLKANDVMLLISTFQI